MAKRTTTAAAELLEQLQTKLQRAEQDLEQTKEEIRRQEESLQMFRSTMDQASDAVFWMNREGSFTYVNEQACRSLGYTREELMRMHLWDIDPGFKCEFWDTAWEQLAEIHVFTHESTHRRKDGTSFPIEVSAKLIKINGFALHVAFVRDITERKRAEEQRLELERQLLHSQKLESLGVLSGGIAHDFNNLLMAVLGNLELTCRKLSSDSPVRDLIDRAMHASHRAADLTRQMLAYSGKGRFVIEDVDLGRLMQENAQLLKTSISKNATLELKLEPGIPRINADAAQVQQVIMNLITNASEAIGESQGTITLSCSARDCDRAHLRRSRAGEIPAAGRFVCLEVADTGCGMDEETQRCLFDPFFTTKVVGRGLGMSAILGIVRAHEGTIIVDSVEGRGTTIQVLFPAAGTSATHSRKDRDGASRQTPETEATALEGTVLVVDDEEIVRSACEAMLQHCGLSVLSAADGEQAVAVFRERQGEIDCVLLDLSMPKKDGIATLEELLRIQPDARVILSSGFDARDALRSPSHERLAGFIQKPYDLDGLREILRKVLSRTG